ncbi:MAG: porin family protein [Gammaproteobacteria bacterium]
MRKSTLCALLAASGLAVVAGSSFAGAYAPAERYAPPAPASVYDTAWYVGVGINHDAQFDYETSSYDYDNQDVGANLFIGKQVNRFFSMQLDFSMIGDGDTDGKGSNANTSFSNMYALGLLGYARYPIFNMLNAYAKMGVSYFTADYDTDCADLDMLGFTYGAGLEADFGKWGVRLDYTRITRNGNNNPDPWEAGYIPDLISLNVLYRFG